MAHQEAGNVLKDSRERGQHQGRLALLVRAHSASLPASEQHSTRPAIGPPSRASRQRARAVIVDSHFGRARAGAAARRELRVDLDKRLPVQRRGTVLGCVLSAARGNHLKRAARLPAWIRPARLASRRRRRAGRWRAKKRRRKCALASRCPSEHSRRRGPDLDPRSHQSRRDPTHGKSTCGVFGHLLARDPVKTSRPRFLCVTNSLSRASLRMLSLDVKRGDVLSFRGSPSSKRNSRNCSSDSLRFVWPRPNQTVALSECCRRPANPSRQAHTDPGAVFPMRGQTGIRRLWQ